MSDAFVSTCEKILSATANGLYQGILVAVLAASRVAIVARTNAATRHAVWFGVLLFVAALIPAHYFVSCGSPPENAAAPMPPITRITMDEMMASVPVATPDSAAYETADMSGLLPTLPTIEPQEASGEPTGFQETSMSWLRQFKARRAHGRDPVKSQNCSRSRKISTARSTCRDGRRCRSFPPGFCWRASASDSLSSSGKSSKSCRAKPASVAPSPRLHALFERLRASLVTRGHVRLRISYVHRTAVVLGFFRPVVLLPAQMDKEENNGELEHVLRHELAHVNRRDDWSNLAQQTIQAALFFHPAIWWISSRLSLEREIAC